MSGTLTPADLVRQQAANAVETLSFYNTVNSDGTNASLSTSGSFTLGTYVDIATVSGTTADTNLFVPAGAIYIENHNDTAPVIDSATPVVDTVAGATDNVLVYQGDAAGQTFYAGAGAQDALFTGYGNTFAAGSATGTYVVVAGLQSAATSNSTLAAAPTTAEGNLIAISAGSASVAAGLGDNSIFLGSGNTYIANEGTDTVYAGSGSTTVDGAGSAQVYGGQGALTYYGDGGTATITGAASTGGTATSTGMTNVYGDTGAVTVYGGAGDLLAYGGTGGSNVLVAGGGNATLVGAGTGNELVAGSGSSQLVASTSSNSNDTLFGSTGTGNTTVFLGAGSDTYTGGSSTDFIQYGTGSAQIFEGTGATTYGLNLADTFTGIDVVTGFNASTDFIQLQNAGSITGSTLLARDATVSGGNTFLNDTVSGLSIEFLNTTNITAANFI